MTSKREVAHSVDTTFPSVCSQSHRRTRSAPAWASLCSYLWPASSTDSWAACRAAPARACRLHREFVFLAVILDAYSRKVVGRELDATLAARLPIAALEKAIAERTPFFQA